MTELRQASELSELPTADLVPIVMKSDGLGTSITVEMTKADAAEYQRAQKLRATIDRQQRRRMWRASDAYRLRPTSRRRRALLDAIQSVTAFCNSYQRAEIMLGAVYCQPAEIFWPTFLIDWPACDASWQWSKIILGLMRGHRDHGHPAIPYLDAAQRTFYDTLPDLIEVWRGADRSRVRNISWTTDPKIAAQFATGMRGGAFPDPVIAHAFIPKKLVFFVDDGGEAEVGLDPRHLRKLTIEKFDLTATLRDVIASTPVAS